MSVITSEISQIDTVKVDARWVDELLVAREGDDLPERARAKIQAQRSALRYTRVETLRKTRSTKITPGRRKEDLHELHNEILTSNLSLPVVIGPTSFHCSSSMSISDDSSLVYGGGGLDMAVKEEVCWPSIAVFERQGKAYDLSEHDVKRI
ncbi:hypothetical protein I204_06414 [Kwoniella mangroviensis CBS 8886]|uniref:uncharacterized protein n=1 Tax=Kwoniella mangroviensis CBS 8507 TaxID=1296122 RepID=UPI00080CE629|nr:uncharacterized protein I203_06553 [Kwoniella mangroviensis CBS 8507]OCF64372.1 hypothetical protein I203_06553 [Kwoniella mangroviensis CBS 8507]OCF73184.1 hypothetical protein I204_06414 [Kwoniella mangroviensis CBS 8886]